MTEKFAGQTKEDQLVAAVSHAGVLIPTFGIMIPLIVWITQKDRSAYLKMQALQAGIWQGIALMGQFLFFGCYMLFVIMMVPLAVIADSSQSTPDPSGGAAAGAAIFIMIMCFFLLILCGGLAYLGFGIAGIVKSLRGNDFLYPFIGKWVANRIKAAAEPQPREEESNQS